MTNKRTSPKPKKTSQKKAGKRVHALTGLTKLFGLIRKFVLRKIGKGRVKTPVGKKGSKACAGNTCTPCKGAAPPLTPHAVALISFLFCAASLA